MESLPKLIINEGPVPGQEIDLPQTEMIIGRDSGCDLVFTLQAISRRHARLFFQNGEYFIEDLGSSNGTFVNRQRLSAPHQLHDGDQLHLGNAVTLTFTAPQLTAEQPPLDTWDGTIQVDVTPPLAQTVYGDALPEPQVMPPQFIVSLVGQEPRDFITSLVGIVGN